jgi:hypothetical protein
MSEPYSQQAIGRMADSWAAHLPLITTPRLGAADRMAPGPGEHICEEGPLCPGWEQENPDCAHNSCQRIVNEPAWCAPCIEADAEAMAAAEAQLAAVNGPAQRGICPQCRAQLGCTGSYGAPGRGQAWECPNGHHYAKVGGRFYPPEWGAHISTPGDVR